MFKCKRGKGIYSCKSKQFLGLDMGVAYIFECGDHRPLGYTVGTVQCSDEDLHDAFWDYTMTNVSLPFSIGKRTGRIQISDLTTEPSYNFTVKCTNRSSSHETLSDVTINIISGM